MLVKTKSFSDGALARFRELQRISFAILEDTAAQLKEGETEKEVGNRLFKRYRAAGFTSFFHLPVVLFGERTALPGKWTIGHFFPKSKGLKPGDSIIMDCAPIHQSGYLVDTSYSFCFGENPAHREMMANLAEFRSSICDAVNQDKTFKAIADTVVARFDELNYQPAHQKHPGKVLGHRAVKLSPLRVSWKAQGFDGFALAWFGMKDKLANGPFGRRSPLWNNSPASDHAPHDGLWLVEPHAGKDGVGAKWEEILVIDKGKAYWLDETPPHVRQWAQIAAGESYSPQAAEA